MRFVSEEKHCDSDAGVDVVSGEIVKELNRSEMHRMKLQTKSRSNAMVCLT